MVKAFNITRYLGKYYPRKIAEKWDRVGLQLGSANRNVNKVLVVLDVTNKVLDYAIENNCEMIIAHHPFLFFHTLEEEYQKAPYKEEMIKRIKENKIVVFAMHTNYDKNYMSYAAVSRLGFERKQLRKIPDSKYGLMIHHECDFHSLVELLKEKLSFSFIGTNVKENIDIKKIAIFPGSGSIEEVINAKNKGADIVITSDLKWSDQITINEEKINVLSVSHAIEDVIIDHIPNLLEKKFQKAISVFSLSRSEILTNISNKE